MFRVVLIVVLALNLGLSAYFRSRARRASGTISRGEEGPLLVLLRLAFTLPLLLALLAYVIDPAWMAWSSVAVPTAVRWVGVVLGVAVVPFTYWVLRSIGSNISETVLTKDTHELVTDGPYRWVRHPLYTAGLLLLTTASLLSANWFIGGMTVLIAVIVVGVVIPREEANLIGAFGEAYRTYRQRTGRLWPRLRG